MLDIYVRHIQTHLVQESTSGCLRAGRGGRASSVDLVAIESALRGASRGIWIQEKWLFAIDKARANASGE